MFLEEHRQRQIHVDSTGRQWAGFGCEQPDADRLADLGGEDPGSRDAGYTGAGEAANELSSRNRHQTLPRIMNARLRRLLIAQFIERKSQMIK
ncbi:hypothetical protein [Bradyrhizobium sp.]|uniref:hypothetical protein n=1 Tax=Bradyrhizobium sp. TaxID=376 RepID=UPI0025C13FA1|nr:hypothetical protein [Bradyrhizobium sp.]